MRLEMSHLEALDVYAELNPAFCALALSKFLVGAREAGAESFSLAPLYLVLPVCAASEFAYTFDGTNKKTGFLEWFRRYPEVSRGLYNRISGCMIQTTRAIQFGTLCRILQINPD